MSDCIFCKLANGEIPTAKLYEDDKFTVILDAGPASKGHALILPKAHYANLLALPEDLTGEAFVLARKMAARLKEALGCDGINIVQNNGETAGQSVFHFHIHIIPRYKGGPRIVANWLPGTVTEETKEEIIRKLQAVKD